MVFVIALWKQDHIKEDGVASVVVDKKEYAAATHIWYNVEDNKEYILDANNS